MFPTGLQMDRAAVQELTQMMVKVKALAKLDLAGLTEILDRNPTLKSSLKHVDTNSIKRYISLTIN